MIPVASMLVNVVPMVAASKPPASGVQVLFRLNAASSKLNSVLEVPISRESRDFKGPRMYEALQNVVCPMSVLRSAAEITSTYVLMAPYAQ